MIDLDPAYTFCRHCQHPRMEHAAHGCDRVVDDDYARVCPCPGYQWDGRVYRQAVEPARPARDS